MLKKMILITSVLIVFALGCSIPLNNDAKFVIETKDEYKNYNDSTVLVRKTIIHRNRSDKRLISKLIKQSNYTNDSLMFDSTGISREDGLVNFSLDSTLYDLEDADIVTISYEWSEKDGLKSACRKRSSIK